VDEEEEDTCGQGRESKGEVRALEERNIVFQPLRVVALGDTTETLVAPVARVYAE
jgi:hypothetical protein